MTVIQDPNCVRCPARICENRGGKPGYPPLLDNAPDFCPMKTMPEAFSEASAEYEKSSVREFARLAAVQKSQGVERYPTE